MRRLHGFIGWLRADGRYPDLVGDMGKGGSFNALVADMVHEWACDEAWLTLTMAIGAWPGKLPEGWGDGSAFRGMEYQPELVIFACSVPFVVLFLWPFLDRGKERHPRRRPIAVGIGVLGLSVALFLGFLGHISETDQTFFGTRYHIDLLGRPHVIAPDDTAAIDGVP